MSAKTKAYTETQIDEFTIALRDLDGMVSTLEKAIKFGMEGDKPHFRARLEAYTLARDAVARRLSKMQEAREAAT